MASLTDRALVIAEDLGSKVSGEALDELKGESGHSWALVVSAFVVGAAVAAVAIVFGLRRVADTMNRSEAARVDESESSLAPGGPTRSWEHWAHNARAGLSAAFRFPSRS